jgi:hypothetical protein
VADAAHFVLQDQPGRIERHLVVVARQQPAQADDRVEHGGFVGRRVEGHDDTG